jgi:hypothetical protein
VECLRRCGEAWRGAGAALKRLADAQEPLYTSFDESQKHRFHVLSRLLAHHPMRFAGMRQRGDSDRDGYRHRRGHEGPRGGYRL